MEATKKPKIKVEAIQDRFDKDCRGILLNGRRIMNIWRKRDRYGTRWESDRFSGEYDTVQEAKDKIRYMAEEGYAF